MTNLIKATNIRSYITIITSIQVPKLLQESFTMLLARTIIVSFSFEKSGVNSFKFLIVFSLEASVVFFGVFHRVADELDPESLCFYLLFYLGVDFHYAGFFAFSLVGW